MRQEVIDIIIEMAREVCEMEADADSLTEETVLFGEGGLLDSMGLVTLIVAVEQEIEDRFEASAGLADEKAMSQANSPFRSVATLADYAVAQIGDS